MPFEKDNKLWKKSHEAAKDNKNKLNDLMELVVTGGFTDYAEKLSRLNDKEKLEKPEQEFMDRLERMFEYVAPKKARTELTGKDGKDLPTPILEIASKKKK
jgi:hypothetical protein